MATVSQSKLERLFELAHSSHFNEAAFYTHLIQAMVFVHVPVSDDAKSARLIQFRHPGGFDAIPVFTSALRCAQAASAAVKSVQVPCIELFRATRGATLMINPNDGGPVLYPEEVAVLLEKGTLEAFEKLEQTGGTWDVRPAQKPSLHVVEALRAGAASASFIRQVYLLEKREPDSEELILLVYVGADSVQLERAARHMVQVLQNLRPRSEAVMDVAVYDAEIAQPAFLDELGAVPVFG
ncbi:MAG: SseB family protein [Pseudoxanthomonas sp.]|nr:SseB family protein [Pseudoxanthomonas sp.]